MAKSVIIEMGPFEGLRLGPATRYIQPSQASLSNGVDYSHGAILPIWGAGPSLATLSSAARWLHLADGGGAVYQTDKNFTCIDGVASMGGGLTGISYITVNNGGVLDVPLMYAGPNWSAVDLGPPAAFPVTSSVGAGSQRAYRITRYKKHTAAGFIQESNPSAAITVNAIPNTLSWSNAGTASTDIDWGTRVYATLNGTTTGPYYLIYEGNAASTGVVDNGMACNTTVPLNWDVDGNPANTLYPFDHSPPIAMYVLADKLLGVPAVPAGSYQRTYSGTPRGGILFGAWNNRLFWSATGYPWYWPTLNVEDLDDVIEAIIVDQLTAYVITRSGVYVVTGTDDTALDIRKSAAIHGCIPEGGPAACLTPYGLLYPGKEGIILFDGANSRNLTADSLGNSQSGYGTWTSGYSGGYVDGAYILANANFRGYVLDLGQWPKVNVTRIPTTIASGATGIVAMAWFRPYASAGTYDTGFYLIDQAGELRRWSPLAGQNFSDRLSVAAHSSGALGSGTHAKRHRFIRFWAQTTDANVSFTFSCYQGDTFVASHTTTATAGWLPNTFTGDAVYCSLSVTASTGGFYGVRVEAEVYD